MDKVEIYANQAVDWGVGFFPKLLLAGAVLFIGFFVIKKVSIIVRLGLERSGLDVEIVEFLGSLIDMVLKVFVVLMSVGFLGVKMTALIGLLAAAGFAIGLALQGFLGNFASGLTILIFKPYRIGDWVKVSDHFGKVMSIEIFNTSLVTPNDKTLVIPNGQVTDNIITNYSTKGNIRLELQALMPYEESFPRVEKTIREALAGCQYVVNIEQAQVGIEAYDTHYIVVAVRPYIHPDMYWEATFDLNARIKNTFHSNGIKMAYSEGVELGEIGM